MSLTHFSTTHFVSIVRKTAILALAWLLSFVLLSGCGLTPSLDAEPTAEAFDPYTITWRDTLHPLRYERALRHLRAGRYSQAEAVYRELIELEPDKVNPYVGLGASLNLQSKFEQARQVYLEGLAIAPGSVQAHIGLGSALFRLERYEEAYQQYGLALDLEKNNPEAIWGLSIALEALGRPDEAVPYWQRILQLEAGTERADWAQSMLDQYSESGEAD